MCATPRGQGLVAAAAVELARQAAVSVVGEVIPRDAAGSCDVCRCASALHADAAGGYCRRCWDAKLAQAIADEKLAERRRAQGKLEAELAEARKAAKAAARRAAQDRCALVAKGAPIGSCPIFFLVASHDNWVPHEMLWHEAHQYYHSNIELGDEGFTQFQIIVDGDEKRRLYPDSLEAYMGSNFSICGPDEGSKEHVWSIGKHQEENGAKGHFYEVRLHMTSLGKASTVSWVRLSSPSVSTIVAQRYWVRGSWDNCAPHEMNWDPIRQCFHFNLRVGESGEESFQIFVNNAWHQCLYPDEEEGCFYRHPMCGPDSFGQDKKWVIGRHPLDAGSAGARYEVRLRITCTGSARDVDWVRLRSDKTPRVLFPEADSKDNQFVYLADSLHDSDDQAPDMVERLEQVGCVHVTVGAKPHTAGVDVREQLKGDLEQPADLTHTQREQRGCQQRHHPLKEALRNSSGVDSDGEELALCSRCGLPLPEFAYCCADGQDLVHGECMAQLMVSNIQNEDRSRLDAEAEVKQAKRVQYQIGWKSERIPRNISILSKLVCTSAPEGLCCIVLDQQSKTLQVAPTLEPAEAVNLPYLSLALQVRLREDREPVFSLDPIDDMHGVNGLVGAASREAWMQQKRFEPAWLAGTSVGEIMFQADYHLKELSMGEYAQPVLGMKSASDLSVTQEQNEEWNAREWFVVRKAAVYLTEGSVLVPHVKMGVEAREQVRGVSGLEDAKIQRPDHPLVKYAEAFTENFDLIAERKSVIYHLRELAKASTLAKFFLEAKVLMEDSWFSLADHELAPCVMAVPQLWNERCYSDVRLQDGKIVDEEHLVPSFRGVYGGVQMGLEKFPLTQAAAVAPPRARMPPAGVRAAGVRALRHPGVRLPTARLGQAPAAPVQAMRLAGLGFEAMPQGVDLNLDEFNLSEATVLGNEAKAGTWTSALRTSSDVCTSTFWSQLEDQLESGLTDEDRTLLKAIFNPNLSDRRSDGDLFVPPDTSASYVQLLQSLLKKEAQIKQQRIEHFCNADFSIHDAGSLFPSSWISTIEMSRRQTPHKASSARARGGLLQPCPDYAAETDLLKPALACATPSFDKTAEDGLRFRVYRVGSLEVRTIQEYDGKELVGQVFKLADAAIAHRSRGGTVSEHDKIAKVTKFVEHTGGLALGTPGSRPTLCQYFVVLETCSGQEVVTEKLEDGTVTWEENPLDLRERSNFAKVVSSADAAAGVTVKDMKLYKASCFSQAGCSPSKRKRYAQGALRRAMRAPEAAALHQGGAKGKGKGLSASLGRAPRAAAGTIRMPSSFCRG